MIYNAPQAAPSLVASLWRGQSSVAMSRRAISGGEAKSAFGYLGVSTSLAMAGEKPAQFTFARFVGLALIRKKTNARTI